MKPALALAALFVASWAPSALAQCPSWRSDLQLPGLSGNARALLAHDDGSGRKLYVGGDFRAAGRLPARYLARWTGMAWETFGGPGPDSTVEDLAEFDDGTGTALYACGGFGSIGGISAVHIARWDGTSWSAVGGGISSLVRALEVYDDGTGPALYAAGTFTVAGGVPANSIARWDGTAWTPLGTGLVYNNVSCLAVYDDGNGPALYAGGSIHTAGGVSVSNVARWRNGAWSAVGTWNSHFRTLCVHDDGGGPRLYAGGTFSGGVIRFDNGAWSIVGSGLSGGPNPIVSSLASYDDGSGSRLYASGSFRDSGGVSVRQLARWDGQAWSQVGQGTDAGSNYGGDSGRSGFATFDDGLGGGTSLYVGGGAHGAVSSSGISRWNGLNLVPLSAGAAPYATIGTSVIESFAVYDDGSGEGEELYAAGNFDYAGSVHSAHFARWNGWRWRPFGGMNLGDCQPDIRLVVHDDGSGPALHAWGALPIAGVQTWRIFRWGQGQWTPLHAQGFTGTFGDDVLAMASLDVGGGRALYAAGTFTGVDGVAAANVVRYANGVWGALGAGLSGQFSVGRALASFDDGGGTALYVGGDFFRAGSTDVNSIASWRNGAWSALGLGVQTASGARGKVTSLAVYDDGSGPGLYVAGLFARAGGTPASNVACWKQGAWSALGAGITTTTDTITLTVHDDGSGATLYATGSFTSAGGVPARNIARWDGVSWSPVGSGAEIGIWRVASYAGGLYVWGPMDEAGGRATFKMARWEADAFRDCDGDGVDDACELAAGTELDADLDEIPDGCQPAGAETVCAGDGSSVPCPCAGPAAAGRGCGNSLYPRGASLEAFGAARVGADTLSLVARDMPNAAALYFQGTQRVRSAIGAGSPLGDGLRCAGGTIVRLGVKANAGNGSRYPVAGDLAISVRGLVPAIGARRVYQVWYRNAAPGFCTAATSNLTNAVAVDWKP